MKVLLQHRENGQYLHSDGTAWTAFPVEARQFRSTTEAVDLCAEQRLVQVDILLKFQQERHDIRLTPPPNPTELRFHILALFTS